MPGFKSMLLRKSFFAGILMTAAMSQMSCDIIKPEREEESSFLAAPGSILYTSRTSWGSLQIYSMEPDGSGARLLTREPESTRSGVWSPDGSRIVFESLTEVTEGDVLSTPPRRWPVLYVVDADGKNRYRLTRTAEPGVHMATGMNPIWSPDGEHVVFRRLMLPEFAGRLDVFMVNMDGSEERRITDDSRFSYNLTSWSTGDLLLGSVLDSEYRSPTSGLPANNSRLIRMDLSGRFDKIWEDIWEDGLEDRMPVLSHIDGRIAFSRLRRVEVPTADGITIREPRSVIHIMDADGSNMQSFEATENHYVWPVAWSPDGKQLLFNAENPNPEASVGSGMRTHYRILILDVASGEVTDITPCSKGLECAATSWKR